MSVSLVSDNLSTPILAPSDQTVLSSSPIGQIVYSHLKTSSLEEGEDAEKSLQGITALVGEYLGPYGLINPKSVVYKVIHAPHSLLGFQFGKMQVTGYGAIGECNCKGFNRLGNTKREELEEVIIQSIENLELSKENYLHILSIGSGGCFEEVVCASKLALREGFSNMTINVIDNCYKSIPGEDYGNTFGSSRSVDQMKLFFQNEITPLTKKTIEIDSYSDYDDYVADLQSGKKPGPHLILLIDMDGGEAFILPLLYKINPYIVVKNFIKTKAVIAFTQGEARFAYDYRHYLHFKLCGDRILQRDNHLYSDFSTK